MNSDEFAEWLVQYKLSKADACKVLSISRSGMYKMTSPNRGRPISKAIENQCKLLDTLSKQKAKSYIMDKLKEIEVQGEEVTEGNVNI
ncbi:MAG: hypothetical protein ACKVJ5_21680 [Pseudoalteromonas sp.]